MTRTHTIILSIIGVLFLISLGLGVWGFMRGLEEARKDPAISPDIKAFMEQIQTYVVENIGQPIEGFDARIYLNAFPGLLESDFDGVETREGEYVYRYGELAFKRTKNQPITSAEEAILENGHQILFENVHGRLGVHLSVEEIVAGITAQGLGTATGTITRGPICPVMKDPPEEECADKPVFAEFIVQNIMGNVEFARFSTDTLGNFSVTLPAGEYNITPAEQIGIGIQGHLIEVRAGETTNYQISFDTGIR